MNKCQRKVSVKSLLIWELESLVSNKIICYVSLVVFMSSIPGLLEWSIGLANDRVQGQVYFGLYTRTFLRVKKV